MNAIIYFADKTTKTVALAEKTTAESTILTLPVSEFSGKAVENIDFAPEYLCAKEGDEGYAIIPSGNTGTLLCKFVGKENGSHTSSGAVM